MDEQLIYESITEKVFEDNIVECRKQFEEFRNKYLEGTLSAADLRKRFTGIFIKGFEEFAYKNNLNLIRPSVKNRWERFEYDYYLWKNGQHPCSRKGDIWMKYSFDSDGVVHAGDEVSYIDKERFFSLMEAFRVPVDYYKPAPEDTVFSSMHLGRFPHEMDVGGTDYWLDDGGLLSKDFQSGSLITLTDRYGLKAVIKNIERISPEEKKKRRLDYDYIGNGHIEGYTSSRDRNIGIDMYKGKIYKLYTEIDDDDREVFYSFPLWQTELQYNRESLKRTWDVVDNLLKEYLGSSYDLSKFGDDEYSGYIVWQ